MSDLLCDKGQGNCNSPSQKTSEVSHYCTIMNRFMNHHKSVGPNFTTYSDMLNSPHLELQLHAGDILSRFNLRQPLDVGVQIPSGDFSVPAGHGLQQCVVNEDVLVLRLDHVVPLGAHERDMAVDVNSLLMLDSFRHGVDHDEAARAAHSSTEPKIGGKNGSRW